MTAEGTNTGAKANTGAPRGAVWPALLGILVLIVATGTMIAQSSANSLVFDELLTWSTDTLATPGMIWHSIKVAPLPLDPPLYHWIEYSAIKTFGESDLAIRLTSMVGMLAALWLVYVFARRIANPGTGLIAMSIIVASGALSYGYNARPYGLVLAAAAGALVSWQNIVRDKSRFSSILCFGACLAIADSSHYYSVLLNVPFAAGEFVRAWRRRKIDWPVLAAMAAGNAIMVAFLPLLPATRAYENGYWRGVQRSDLMAAYQMFFGSARKFEAIVAFLIAAYIIAKVRARARSNGGAPAEARALAPEEAATLIAFAVYPLIVFAFSREVTHTFAERFTVPAILGLSILPAVAMRSLAGSNAVLTAIAAVVLSLGPLQAFQAVRHKSDPPTRYSPHFAPAMVSETAVFNQLPESSKIVITSHVLFLRMMKYAPQPIRQRAVFVDLVDAPVIPGRKNIDEMIALGIRVGVGMPTMTVGEVRNLTDPYYLVCCRSFEPLEEPIQRLKSDLLPVMKEVGSYRYWPVFLVAPKRR